MCAQSTTIPARKIRSPSARLGCNDATTWLPVPTGASGDVTAGLSGAVSRSCFLVRALLRARFRALHLQFQFRSAGAQIKRREFVNAGGRTLTFSVKQPFPGA